MDTTGTFGSADPLDAFFVSESELEDAGESYLGGLQSHARVATNTTDVLNFWVCSEEYAVPIEAVQEIIKVPAVTVVPRVGAAMSGLISLRGTIVPVLDLSAALGTGSFAQTRKSRVVVLRADGSPVGMLVDRIAGVIRLAPDAIEQKPDALRGRLDEFVAAIGRHQGRMLVILDRASIVARVDMCT